MSVASGTRFRLLPPELPPDELEQEMLARWAAEDILARTLREREGAPDFVFYEGPPTANGRPGIHHIFARTIKDLFCRYYVQKGRRVLRKAGWDTHGLPVEIEVEKQLGISGKQQIEEIGVEEFNRRCRESVWTYKEDWERLSARIGYWLDYADPYITYENRYIESVWWALRTLYDRDLLVRGYKILPYCARCGTALSSHEVAQGYADVEDPSVYVALPLVHEGRETDRRILVWTTTPWTLVSNVALAVHPDLHYVEVRVPGDSHTLIVAESRATAVLGEGWVEQVEVVGRFAGSALIGARYRRPLDWIPYTQGEHEIIVGETFVSAEDGTGVVHMAPAFGADDYAAGRRHGLSFLQPVDARGQFPAGMPVAGGRFVKDADPLLIDELRRRGVLFRAERIHHAYPHCWRCDTPLLYYAKQSWFVRTTAFADRMLARNRRINWSPPEVGEGRFGVWLEGNIDWALSRDRYWGTPLPVWVCDADGGHRDVIGSFAELSQRWGRALPDGFDPHKPFIDSYEWSCRQCGGRMRRVPEVIDTWFDSGSMPFAQWHYPFENHDRFGQQFPADFIAEGVDQTRGWFYSLLAIATGLGDALPGNELDEASPYRAVVVNDLVLDAEGQKMSKTRGNVVDPWSVLPRYGADAVRLFLIASSQVWVPRRFDEDGIRDLAGRFLLTMKNVYSGIFAQYANFGWSPDAGIDPPPAERAPIDRWMMSRLAVVEQEVDEALARFEPTAAARAVMQFFTDDVSNWYVRLNRNRFYDVDGADNRAAFATLHETLVVTCRLLAPFAPFITDWMHRELTGDTVHVAPFRRAAAFPRDDQLELAMSHVRRLVTLGRAAREEAGLKVRQPLARMVCVVPGTDYLSLDVLVPLLSAELNMRRVEFVSSGDELVRLQAKANFRELGKRFGPRTPVAAKAIEGLSAASLAALERGEPVAITVDGESHEVRREEVTILRRAAGDLVVQEEGGYIAAIDPRVTPALRSEGLARELVSRVQRLRKEAGLAVSDRIALHAAGYDELERVVQEYRDYIAAEVLAVDVTVGGEPEFVPLSSRSVDLDGSNVRVAITRV